MEWNAVVGGPVRRPIRPAPSRGQVKATTTNRRTAAAVSKVNVDRRFGRTAPPIVSHHGRRRPVRLDPNIPFRPARAASTIVRPTSVCSASFNDPRGIPRQCLLARSARRHCSSLLFLFPLPCSSPASPEALIFICISRVATTVCKYFKLSGTRASVSLPLIVMMTTIYQMICFYICLLRLRRCLSMLEDRRTHISGSRASSILLRHLLSNMRYRKRYYYVGELSLVHFAISISQLFYFVVSCYFCVLSERG